MQQSNYKLSIVYHSYGGFLFVKMNDKGFSRKSISACLKFLTKAFVVLYNL